MIIIDGKLAGLDTIELLQQHNAYYRSASALATGDMLSELASLPDVSPAGGMLS
jgi:hypothetical protein